MNDILTKVRKLKWWQDIIAGAVILVGGLGLGYILSLFPDYEIAYILAFSSLNVQMFLRIWRFLLFFLIKIITKYSLTIII